MKKTLCLLATLALLVACSSPVKLNEVPVEDKAGTQVAAPAAAPAPAPPSAPSTVARIDVRPLASVPSGPAGVSSVIYFDYDSFAIKPEFQAVIEKHAAYIKQDTKRRVAVEGHTDERGGREYNLALGQKRSEAVRKALNLLGVTDGQIEAVSLGKEKPAMTGSSEEAFAKNRRAEIAYK
jgi:peptidoglycan-associated lipoprotein